MLPQTFEECWAIVELAGGRLRAGFVGETEVAGGKMLRVDLPIDGGNFRTELYHINVIRAIRPNSESVILAAIAADPRLVAELMLGGKPAHPEGPSASMERQDGAERGNVIPMFER